ncbi:MAG TPA: ATP-binding cassette domain-containing protein, partial [Caldimonas sp.]
RFKAKASKARQAQSRVKALARMERLAPVLTSADFQFEFREPMSLPNPMLAFADVACGYRSEDGHAKRIVDHIDRSVLAGQRIGILGANGQGKSTFVKTIAGTLAPLEGTIVAGKGLTIGYFAQQELDVLSPGDGPLMHMVRLARDVGPAAREQELRDFLGSFRFTGEMVQQPVGTLSGGEKARLVLAMLVWQRPNLLLLDEPTNHLDLTTREALSMALNEFEGTVMLVSHDRALLREVCDEFWLVSGGALAPFDGDLDDYQRWLLEQARIATRAARPQATPETRPTATTAPAPPVAARGGESAPRPDRKAAAAARQQRADAAKPLRRELNLVDNRLGVLFAERDALEAAGGEALDAEQRADNGRRLKAVGAEIELLEGRWLELSTQLDDIAESVG